MIKTEDGELLQRIKKYSINEFGVIARLKKKVNEISLKRISADNMFGDFFYKHVLSEQFRSFIMQEHNNMCYI